MISLTFSSEFFNIKDTLECGQIFRYKEFNDGYLVFSLNKCCFCKTVNDKTIIECESSDKEYFENYFDIKRDYSLIVKSAQNEGDFISKCALTGKGIRILNQDITETLFSFIVSQNNNIPRIKGIIEKICASLGEKKSFNGIEYFGFPKVLQMAEKDTAFYSSLGLGYRAEYIRRLAENISNGFDILSIKDLSTKDLRKKLIEIYGVGPKVADCVLLFGYRKTDSFPVDTWIEKVYRENLKGEITDRKKISDYLVNKYKENSGYFQQYVFYYKRSLENK